MKSIKIRSKHIGFENVSTVIFDKDGTLTDSHFYWAEIIRRRVISIQKEFNIDKNYYELIANSMGLDIRTNSLISDGPIAIKSRNEVIKKVVETLNRINYQVKANDLSDLFISVHNSFKSNAISYIKPINSACEFVKLCHLSNLKLILLTSDTQINAEIAMAHIGLKDYFDMIIGGDSGFGDKTTGGAVKYILDEMTLKPQEVVAIGDAPADFEMALNSKLNGTILVATGQIPFDDLLKITPCCVKSLLELSL